MTVQHNIKIFTHNSPGDEDDIVDLQVPPVLAVREYLCPPAPAVHQQVLLHLEAVRAGEVVERAVDRRVLVITHAAPPTATSCKISNRNIIYSVYFVALETENYFECYESYTVYQTSPSIKRLSLFFFQNLQCPILTMLVYQIIKM